MAIKSKKPVATGTGMKRPFKVRKTWEDTKSQIGSYGKLSSAQAVVDELAKAGDLSYKVWEDGEIRYEIHGEATLEEAVVEVNVEEIPEGIDADTILETPKDEECHCHCHHREPGEEDYPEFHECDCECCDCINSKGDPEKEPVIDEEDVEGEDTELDEVLSADEQEEMTKRSGCLAWLLNLFRRK